jgi:hypothetical protein
MKEFSFNFKDENPRIQRKRSQLRINNRWQNENGKTTIIGRLTIKKEGRTITLSTIPEM